jgi:hypothetical protein
LVPVWLTVDVFDCANAGVADISARAETDVRMESFMIVIPSSRVDNHAALHRVT